MSWILHYVIIWELQFSDLKKKKKKRKKERKKERKEKKDTFPDLWDKNKIPERNNQKKKEKKKSE